MDATSHTAERVARESYGRLVAFLSARTRDLAGAEDALADAFAQALQSWPVHGVPDNPDAWLLTVARRRQTDAIRRQKTSRAGQEHVILMTDELDAAAANPDAIPDRRLALMFACADPAVEPGMRPPLMLQTILGLNARDIASAFLISPATMGQRLVRAKSRIKASGAPFRLPEREELPERLDAVLEAIYAAYAKGWGELVGEGTPPLAAEAIWLAQIIVALLPAEPEAKGLLALMLYAESRRPARSDASGAFVPLDQQDTALWDAAQLAMAEALLHQANAGGPSGRYQIEAAIQSAHTARRLQNAPVWPAIAALYDHLYALTASPVAGLNRAMAHAETEGPAAALALLDAIASDPRLSGYQPYWAARGHLLAALGHNGLAHEAFTLAIGLSEDNAVRQYLHRRRAGLVQA